VVGHFAHETYAVATTGGGALELLTRLRDDWITVPVVILTAYDDAGLSEVAFSLGAARDVPEGRDGRRMPRRLADRGGDFAARYAARAQSAPRMPRHRSQRRDYRSPADVCGCGRLERADVGDRNDRFTCGVACGQVHLGAHAPVVIPGWVVEHLSYPPDAAAGLDV
jgi:hypothetical protein